MTVLLKLLIVALPWPVKRHVLQRLYRYDLARDAKIGLSWFFPGALSMAAGAQVGHLNVAVHLDEIRMGERSKIGRSNWITGFPSRQESKHFAHQTDRRSRLTLGAESAITKGHRLDCTSPITIGEFVTIAGHDSEFLTHSIDIKEGRQDSAPIAIGDYSFVGTRVVVLAGAALPERSVLGAMSLLNSAFESPEHLYAGVPAKQVKALDPDSVYFHRQRGFVD